MEFLDALYGLDEEAVASRLLVEEL
jgi:hypothetical protein